jgi:beta-lactamase regulating signal transducer with metallopeptidase domain
MIKASILLGAAFCLSGLLKRRSAAERHLVWATVIGLAVCLPLLETAVPRWQPDVARRAAAAIPFFSRTGVSRDVLDADDIVVRADSIDAGVSPLTGALTVVWLIGVVAASFATWRAGRLLSRHGRRARRIDDAAWRTVLDEVSHAVGAGRPVRLLRGDHESVPVTWGWRRPRIVVPASSRDWHTDRIRVVLAHELAHIRRRDWLVQLTARAACVVYWFNPLFWLACDRLNREGEQACDDIVLGLGVDRRDYATHSSKSPAASVGSDAQAGPRDGAPIHARTTVRGAARPAVESERSHETSCSWHHAHAAGALTATGRGDGRRKRRYDSLQNSRPACHSGCGRRLTRPERRHRDS